jgi:Protein of unknown function (DUF3429)
MTPIPRAALWLGLAGLIPFFWAAATHMSPRLAEIGLSYLPPMFLASYLGLTYGSVILSFMSGVLWGFATRAEGHAATLCYGLSVLPALWVAFAVNGAAADAALLLGAGFVGLLGLDWHFWRAGLAPDWWMRLRLNLTVPVVVVLGLLAFG